jgi:hypothetical protein
MDMRPFRAAKFMLEEGLFKDPSQRAGIKTALTRAEIPETGTEAIDSSRHEPIGEAFRHILE